MDLQETATIPPGMWEVAVPRIEVKSAFLREGPAFFRVLEVYNHLSEQGDKGLGRWLMFWPTVTLASPGQLDPQAEPALGVRAFSMYPLEKEECEKMIATIETEWASLQAEVRLGRYGSVSSTHKGTLHFHPESEILVAIGDRTFVDLAGGVAEAYLAKYKARRALMRGQ